MFIIVGLGNPESEYKGTRHNAGFEVIDVLAEKYNISVDIRKHRAFIGKGQKRHSGKTSDFYEPERGKRPKSS